MIEKIATASLYVADQAAAVAFWTDQVGFEIHRQRSMGPGSSWIEIGPPGAASCLVIYPKSMMEDWAERRPSIVFECADIRATFDAMRSRGVQFTQEPQDMPWGPFAIFLDPEGNWFGLRAPMEGR
jgi:predicted enzyme related to lactoylglutathione lyase